jgi:UDP-N-acetylglucosamine 4,6-dehydratase/5-epimerase
MMEYQEIINDKIILITGGTGSLGNQLVNFIIKNYNPKKLIILSRDENKQYNMRNLLSEIKFLDFELGDVRDYERMLEVTKGVDILLHAAALKHVPPGEREPMEFIKTNILGSQNIIKASIENKIPIVVGIGTDKLVKPVNAYGMTKSLQEKMMVAANEKQKNTKFICVRYGNVIGSRGSVIPFFLEKIKKRETLPITVSEMTRFLIPLKDAVDLIFHSIKNGEGGEVFVKKMPSVTTIELAKAMGKSVTGNPNYPVEIIGIRPGEKIHEILVSEDEMKRSKEMEDHYIIYPYGKLKDSTLSNGAVKEYSSENTKRLNQEEIIQMLREDGWL